MNADDLKTPPGCVRINPIKPVTTSTTSTSPSSISKSPVRKQPAGILKQRVSTPTRTFDRK